MRTRRAPTLKQIEKALERYDREVERAIEASAKKLRKQAVLLLNVFQKKVRGPVYLEFNVDSWLYDADLHEQGRYREVWQAAETLALDGYDKITGLRWETSKLDRAVTRLFPELILLAKLATEMDSIIGRPGLGEIRPTVKPKRRNA